MSILKDIQGIILDMDGVLWRDEQAIGDLPDVFAALNQRGWKTVVATNNATRTAEQHLEKLRRFGVHLQAWQVVTSCATTAHYLSRRFPQGGPVFMIGEAALQDSLAEVGIYPDGENQKVLAVVVSMDRQITYEKLAQACLYIRAGVPFIATNPDRTFPSPRGLLPGAGAILAALEAASDVQPIIMGKPALEMYRVALERLGTQPQETLVVGDRLETDIQGAQELGCRTALMLSGVTSVERAAAWRPVPDLICRDLTAMLALPASC